MRAEYVRSAEELAAPGSASVTRLAVVARGLALLLVMIRSRKANDQGDGLRYAAAAVLALIVTGKVLSPQHLVWHLPFVAVLEGPAARLACRLSLAACLATAAAYPWSYMGPVNGFHPLSLAILNLRNALLLILLSFGSRDGLACALGLKDMDRWGDNRRRPPAPLQVRDPSGYDLDGNGHRLVRAGRSCGSGARSSRGA